jgi:DNA-binding NarL/FixJ family response regulator
MTKPMIKIHNVETDEIVEREMNAEEYDQHLQIIKDQKTKEAEAEARATARASALAKLAALGLSADEIASL